MRYLDAASFGRDAGSLRQRCTRIGRIGFAGERARNTRDTMPIVILSGEPHGNARSPSGTGQNGIGAKALPMRDAGEGQGLAADRQ